ncbi:MAG: hypothetical protein GX418_15810 [Clostridiales bacterium]|nr:hypothetical protein [Clostridiales bacterium]
MPKHLAKASKQPRSGYEVSNDGRAYGFVNGLSREAAVWQATQGATQAFGILTRAMHVPAESPRCNGQTKAQRLSRTIPIHPARMQRFSRNHSR